MKITSIISILAILALGCNPPQSGFVVKNDSEFSIGDNAIVLSYDKVNEYLPEDIGENHIVVVDEQGVRLPSQCDDIDGDGQWDELAFLVDLEAEESKTLYFNALPENEVPDFPKRTNIRFAYREEPFVEVEADMSNESPVNSGEFQMEGPAWENDMVGFRNYYDNRNGMDIFGKKTEDMALDSAGIRGQDYHAMDDWGMDILKVGNSLGAGAIGIRVGDVVARVGENEERTFKHITEGPVRAILELGYKDVPVEDRSYDVTHQISIYAGDLFYRSKVYVEGLQGDEDLVTGIVNMEQKESFEMKESGYHVLASHGNQAYLGEKLGMALLVPEDVFIETWESPDEGEGIVETHMMALNISEDTPAEFCFFSGWEYQDDGFKNKEYFEQEIRAAIRKLTLN